MNDYNVKGYLSTPGIMFEWIDMAGDDTKDIRARRFICKRTPSLAVADKQWKRLLEDKAIVWRGQYYCARACQRVVNTSHSAASLVVPEQDPDTESFDMSDRSTTSSHSTGDNSTRGQKTVTKCPVILHVSFPCAHMAPCLTASYSWRYLPII